MARGTAPILGVAFVYQTIIVIDLLQPGWATATWVYSTNTYKRRTGAIQPRYKLLLSPVVADVALPVDSNRRPPHVRFDFKAVTPPCVSK